MIVADGGTRAPDDRGVFEQRPVIARGRVIERRVPATP
jgi:hypothetical protein